MDITGILHVGAHIGEEAEAYDRCGVKKVVWVEGNPELIAELTRNVSVYKHGVIQALVTDVDKKEVTFNVTNNFQSSSIYEFGTHSVVSPDVVFTHQLKLVGRRLDELADEYDFSGLNFLNMDLQGAELVALQGMGNLVKQFKYIYTEINVDELYVGCARLPQLDQYLAKYDFQRVEIAMAGIAGWGDALYVRV